MDHEKATVKQESPEPEFNSWSQQDDVSQQEADSGYQIFFKEEVHDKQKFGEFLKEEEIRTSVESKQLLSSISTSGHDNATEDDCLNCNSDNSINVEECAKPTAAGTKAQVYSCAHCSYETNWLGNLKTHIRKHTHEKQFSCEFYDNKSTQSHNLKNHLKKHTEEKPLSCEFCDYKSTSASNLKRHHRTHTGDKHLSCEFCDFRCFSLTQLKIHIRKHTGQKPFSCQFCDYQSTHSYNLKNHLRTHTGEKPFCCEFCDYKSTTAFNLKRHHRTHWAKKKNVTAVNSVIISAANHAT